MKKRKLYLPGSFYSMCLISAFIILSQACICVAQSKDSLMVASIIKEATINSQLEKLSHELFDVIGPRLVGTPQMKQANDWAVAKYADWGIDAKNERWGERRAGR